ncbi:MAG TPA: M28 family peptidase [Bacteroidota bacterium]
MSSQPKVEKRFSETVSQKRLQNSVHELVSFGNRQGGTPSGDRAVVYLVREFRKLGLKTEIVDDPEKLTYINDRWSIRVLKPASLAGIFDRAWLAGFSPSSRREYARVVAFSTDGKSADVDVDSAAVLLTTDQLARSYDELVAKGAVCFLTWTEPRSDAYADCSLITTLPAKLNNPVPVFDISRKTSRILTKALHAKKQVTIRFSTKTRIRMGRSKTVIATLPGKSESYYVICAHGDSDSGGPGADDNASGESGVLEVARVMTTLRRQKVLRVPDSTIKFIVWGSEYSSTENFVKSQGDRLKNVLAVLNYDEIGTGASRNCIYFEGNDQRVNGPVLRTLQRVGEDYVGKKSFWREATTNPSQGGTDSYVFLPNYLARLGVRVEEIPSVTIYTAAWQEPKCLYQPVEWRTTAWKGPSDSVCIDYSLYYHSSMDVPETTTDREPFNMVWGVKAVGIALLRMAWH